MDKRGQITIDVYGDWPYSTRDMLDWIEMKLAAPKPDDWGTGRGSINYARGEVVSVATTGATDER